MTSRKPPALPNVVFVGGPLRVVVRHDGLLLFVQRDNGMALGAVRASHVIDAFAEANEVVLRGTFGADWAGEREDERRIAALGEDPSAVAAAIRAKLHLPRAIVDVTEQRIREEPRPLDGALVRVRGIWHNGFEGSSLARAWLQPPKAMRAAVPREESAWVDVVAFLRSDNGKDGHGHMGMWPAELRVYSWSVLTRAWPPSEAPLDDPGA